MSALQIVAAVITVGITVVGVVLFVRAIASMVGTFRFGAPDHRTDAKGVRAGTLVREFLGHTRMKRLPVVAAAHWATMIAFGLLFFTLLEAYGQIWDPYFVLPYLGHFYPLEWLTDIFAWAGLIGMIVLIGNRRIRHPARSAGTDGRYSRFFGSTFWQAYFVELVILGVTLCILSLRGLEYALEHATGDDHARWLHYPLTFFLGHGFSGMSAGSMKQLIVVVAMLKIVISMVWMITIALNVTMGIAWHRFLAFFNIFLKRHADGRTSLGELQPMRVGGQPVTLESAEELDEDAVLGVGHIQDFTWKGLLDFSTCTECGRCQSQCPAWNTEKPLSPKLLVMTLREQAKASSPFLTAAQDARASLPQADRDAAQAPLIGDTGYDPDSPLAAYNPGPGTLGQGVIDPDVLWSCTTCGACVEQCPVDIEHVDHIVDMRRYQTLMESAFPSELGGMFRNLETKSNPWGMSSRARLDWAKDLPFDVPVYGNQVTDLKDVDYLYWVGCAGAFEDRAKKTSRAVAELLHTAGVKYAVLGDGEVCTGDPARRAGNELLFQALASQNVATLNEAGATKIVATCAHFFNTLRNEYPQLGGNYEVVHHTQLLNRLVREKRLTPVHRPGDADTSGAASTGASVTFHDPCYLGRHNGVYSPPRELLGSLPGVDYKEMDRSKEKSFCCGAGGARMWMEEKLGTRINTNRTQEAVATGAKRIAVGCPFCRVMLTDGLTAEQADGHADQDVEVVDVANMLLAAVRRGQQETPTA